MVGAMENAAVLVTVSPVMEVVARVVEVADTVKAPAKVNG